MEWQCHETKATCSIQAYITAASECTLGFHCQHDRHEKQNSNATWPHVTQTDCQATCMPTAFKAYPGGCCLLAMRPHPEGIAVYRNMAATRLKTFCRRHDAPLGIRQYGGRRCRPGSQSHANGQRQAAITAEHARLCMPVGRPRLEEGRCRWCMKVA